MSLGHLFGSVGTLGGGDCQSLAAQRVLFEPFFIISQVKWFVNIKIEKLGKSL